MPELPEVETIKNQLSEQLVGKEITAVQIKSNKQFHGGKDKIVGAKITRVWRRAKRLGLDLDNDRILLIHLKMTGQLIFEGDELPDKTTRIIFTFDDGSQLFFNDLRKFGWIKVLKEQEKLINQGDYPDLEELADLGPEPLGDNFSLDYLKKAFAKTRRAVKKVLLDQEVIAGIGNIYSSEILFQAGVDPRRPANKLSSEEIKKIYQMIPVVLQEAIAAGGTTAGDESYRQADASEGNYQNKLRVYQREGQECPRCDGKIKRIKQGGRSTFFCPKCQK